MLNNVTFAFRTFVSYHHNFFAIQFGLIGVYLHQMVVMYPYQGYILLQNWTFELLKAFQLSASFDCILFFKLVVCHYIMKRQVRVRRIWLALGNSRISTFNAINVNCQSWTTQPLGSLLTPPSMLPLWLWRRSSSPLWDLFIITTSINNTTTYMSNITITITSIVDMDNNNEVPGRELFGMIWKLWSLVVLCNRNGSPVRLPMLLVKDHPVCHGVKQRPKSRP